MKFKILLFILFFLPLGAQAIGVSVSPAKLEIIYPSNDKATLIITNISPEPILVTVFPDDLEEFIKISPAEFELMPEEKTPVNILLDFKQPKSGLKKTDISIVSRALEKQSFNAASGIKIPLSIYFDNGLFKWSGLLVFVVVFFSILLAFLLARLIFWLIRPKKKKHFWQKIDFLRQHRRFRQLFARLK